VELGNTLYSSRTHSPSNQTGSFRHFRRVSKPHRKSLNQSYYRIGARYYDADIGGWVSVDPMRQFASPYLYAGNGFNSVNVVDPDGMEARITYGKDGKITAFYNEFNDDKNLYVTNHEGVVTTFEGAQITVDNYFNALDASEVIGKYSWGGDWNAELHHIFTAAVESGDASVAPWFAGERPFDFKFHNPKSIGIAYGSVMTSRDAGNALWGYYMGGRYWNNVAYTMGKIVAGLLQTFQPNGSFQDPYHFGEATKSGNMNNWGYQRAK